MQFEWLESHTVTTEKKPGPNRSISNTIYYYFLTYPLKAEIQFGEK